jgi:hypothetical protein
MLVPDRGGNHRGPPRCPRFLRGRPGGAR